MDAARLTSDWCEDMLTRTRSTLVAPARFGRAFRSLALPVALAFVLLGGPASALAISRDAVLARAQGWVDKPVPYSQVKYHAGYRTDCSGYVSMCWRTGTSWSTRSFHTVTHKIHASQLKPGDAMLKKGHHIRLFYGWADDAHTAYVAYEANSVVAACRVHSMAEDLAAGYVPTRYNHISDSPASANVLKNSSFDVWARSWSQAPELPLWWSVDGQATQPLVAHRKDVYRTARNSLRLANSSANPATLVELSQGVAVKPGVGYMLSAWARTPSNPAGLVLGVAYFNLSGQSVAETSTTGAAWRVGGSAFKRMSTRLVTPPGAVRALVTVQLAGGLTTATATGVGSAGTSVALDDIALTFPQATIKAKSSAASTRRGRKVVLSGPVTPTSAVGVRVVTYVQGPGSSAWKRMSQATVYASGGKAAWRTIHSFTKKSRKGTYHFKTVIPALSGYLGASSNIVSVKVK